MPQVPHQTGPTVAEHGIQGRISAHATPQTGVGDVLQQAGGELAQYARQQKDKADSIAVTDAQSQLGNYVNHTLYDPKDGLLNLQGKNAFGATDTFNKEFDQKVAEIQKGLHNPEQRQAFSKVVEAHHRQSISTLDRHTAHEMDVYDQQATSSALDTAQNTAALNYNDPHIVQDAIERSNALLASQAHRNGLPEATLKENQAAATSNIHASVIDHYVANDEYGPATQYYHAHKNEISADQQQQIDAKLTVERKRREREQQAKLQSEVRVGIKDEQASIERTGKRAGVVSDQMIKAAYPDIGDRMIGQLHDAQKLYQTQQSVALTSPRQDAETLQRIQPSGPGYAQEAKGQDQIKKVLRDKYKALGVGTAKPGDPVSYVLKHSPQLEQDLSNSQNDPKSYQTALFQLQQEQSNLGVPDNRIRVMSDSQATNLVSEIQSAPADRRAAYMTDLQHRFGDYWPKAYNQLVKSGLPDDSLVLGSVVDNPIASQEVSSVLDTPEKDLTSGLDSTDVSSIKQQVNDSLTDFRHSFEAGDFTGSASKAFAPFQNVITKLALAKFRRTGDASKAVTDATNTVINDNYSTLQSGDAPEGKGIAAYVPTHVGNTRIEPAKVESVAEAAQTPDAIKAFDPAPIGSPGTPDFISEARIRKTAQDSGFWVTNEHGDGLVLMVPFKGGGALPVVNKQGHRYEIKFTDAMQAADTQPAGHESSLPAAMGGALPGQ